MQKKLIAIRELDNVEEHGEEWNNGYQVALEEINIPMETITEDWCPSVCPRCGEAFFDYEPCDDGYYTRAISMSRCPHCGQRIFWK